MSDLNQFTPQQMKAYLRGLPPEERVTTADRMWQHIEEQRPGWEQLADLMSDVNIHDFEDVQPTGGDIGDFAEFMFSLGPNALSWMRQGDEHRFDQARTYSTELVDAGLPWQAAGVLGTLLDFLEPGPEAAKALKGIGPALAALPMLPRAFQKMLGKHLPSTMLDIEDMPLTQFHASGTGTPAVHPRVLENREQHGHAGAFTSFNPAYVTRDYLDRYLPGPRYGWQDSPHGVTGMAMLPHRPSVVEPNFLDAASPPPMRGGRVLSRAEFEDELRDYMLDAGMDPVDVGDFMKQHAGQPYADMMREADSALEYYPVALDPEGLTHLHRHFGYDGHVDMRPGWPNPEVAVYDQAAVAPLTDEGLENMVQFLLAKGESPEDILLSWQAEPVGSADAARLQLDAISRQGGGPDISMRIHNPLDVRNPRGYDEALRAAGMTRPSHHDAQNQMIMERFMELVLDPFSENPYAVHPRTGRRAELGYAPGLAPLAGWDADEAARLVEALLSPVGTP